MVQCQELTEYQLWLEQYGEVSIKRILSLLEQHEQQLSFRQILKILPSEPINFFDKIKGYLHVMFQKLKIDRVKEFKTIKT